MFSRKLGCVEQEDNDRWRSRRSPVCSFSQLMWKKEQNRTFWPTWKPTCGRKRMITLKTPSIHSDLLWQQNLYEGIIFFSCGWVPAQSLWKPVGDCKTLEPGADVHLLSRQHHSTYSQSGIGQYACQRLNLVLWQKLIFTNISILYFCYKKKNEQKKNLSLDRQL